MNVIQTIIIIDLMDVLLHNIQLNGQFHHVENFVDESPIFVDGKRKNVDGCKSNRFTFLLNFWFGCQYLLVFHCCLIIFLLILNHFWFHQQNFQKISLPSTKIRPPSEFCILTTGTDSHTQQCLFLPDFRQTPKSHRRKQNASYLTSQPNQTQMNHV